MERTKYLRQVLGKKLFEKVENSKILMVGSGGIGCELLKNLVMSGFKNIEIIDLDTIDLSNLNRQFLFQKQHIGKSKAKIAMKSALEFNPNVNIKSYHANIKDPQFNLKWFKQFDIVMNALDNLDARRHVNTMCLAANVPLIESGTAGYLGQATVIVKDVTECFECQPKPTPKTYPVCTIRSTPSAPIHCIIWAKNYLFAELFGKSEEQEDMDMTDEKNSQEIEDLKKEAKALKELNKLAGTPDYAEKVFEKVFYSDICRLLNMENLWKTRSKPKPIDSKTFEKAIIKEKNVTKENKTKMEDDQSILTIEENINLFKTCLERLVKELLKGKSMDPEFIISFEKDDDTIMKFVAATANIRAYIFGIEQLNRFKIKEIAGNIIPSIATTNAIIAGVIIMDAYKILNNKLEECNTIYLTHNPGTSNVFVNEFLAKPNPRCAVCRKSYFILTVNTEKFTLKDLLHKVLMNPRDQDGLALSDGEFTICEEQRILYDVEYEDKLNSTFKQVGILDGKTLNITCDVEDKMYNIMIYIIDDNSLESTYKLEGNKENISFILPPEPDISEKEALKKKEEERVSQKRKHDEEDKATTAEAKKPKIIEVDIVDNEENKPEEIILD